MKISVLMSVYNDENLLKESIESILNQTYENFELLICNDSSLDNTLKVLSFYEKNDSRIKVINNKKNIGLTKSLNKLINISEGELIARQDSDDISLKTRFEEQVHYIEKKGYDVVLSRAYRKQGRKYIPGFSYYLPKKFLIKYKNPFIHGTLLIKKTVINEIGNYDENFYYAQDYKLFSDLLNSGYSFKHIKTPLYVLNMKDNISSDFNKQQDYYANCVRKNKLPDK